MITFNVSAVSAMIALFMFFVVIIGHTAALFKWGGGMQQMLKEHDREIIKLREKYHEIAQILQRAVAVLEHLERERA